VDDKVSAPKSKKAKPSSQRKSTESSVLINVGIIRENDTDGSLSIARGSKLPILVPKKANGELVQKLAIEKHSNHDQYFCGLENWSLLYPDQKMVDFIPGTTKRFTVEGYKHELAKPYSKLNLYLCKSHDIEGKESSRLKLKLLENPTLSDDDNGFDNDDVDINLSKESKFDVPTKISTSTGSTIAVSYGMCPICNKKIPFSIIEKHADECLKKKEQPIIYTIEDSDDEINPDIKSEEVAEHTLHIDFRKEIPFLIQHCDVVNEQVVINVRRHNIFEDFQRFFGKVWNKKNLNKIYKFSFIGEPAVDTGGVSREFYSGRLSLTRFT